MSSSTSTQADAYAPEKVLEHLRKTAVKHKLKIKFHENLMKLDGDFLYVPAFLNVKDAYLKAKKLQLIEDQWNTSEPKRHPRVMLVPAKD